MELKEYRFDEVTDNFDKKRIPLSSAQRKKRQGKYRYYGAQGVIDHIDDFIFDGTYLLIAEDGENLKSKKQNIAQVVDGQFWVNNHAHIVQGNELCDTRYLCYLLNSMGGCKIFCVYGNETFQIRIRYVVVFVGFCSRIFCRIYLSGYSISCPLSFIHAF